MRQFLAQGGKDSLPSGNGLAVVAADERPAQTLIGIHVVITETPQITHEMALSFRILARPKSVDDVLVGVQVDAAAGAAIGANAVRVLEIPDTLLVKEVLAAQGANGADVNNVAGQLVVARLAGKDIDLRMIAAVNDLQFGRATDLAREANAARTHNAAVGE